MEAIQSLSIDDQLGLLWVLYDNMGGLVTSLAPGATVQLKIERGIKTKIITTYQLVDRQIIDKFIYVDTLYSNQHKLMKISNLDNQTIDRIVEMAWEDRTPFEAIEVQFGLQEKHVIQLMRRSMTTSSFKMWRKRVTARNTKHLRKRDFTAGRFKSNNQKN